MRTGNLKKYIIPNIPYLFIGWAFLKLGTAYRLAAEADFLSKVMGIGPKIREGQQEGSVRKGACYQAR